MRRRSSTVPLTGTVVLSVGALLATAAVTWGHSAPPVGLATPSSIVVKPLSGHAKPGGPQDRLGAHDRMLLGAAQARGDSSVTAMIMTDPDRYDAVLADAQARGAQVAYERPTLGYARVVMPTGAVSDSAHIPGVQAIDLDERVQAAPTPPDVVPPTRSGPTVGPTASTPANNPFMPITDTGMTTFLRDHPTYDGRGITIGIMDSGVDFTHPALARTSTGIPKVTRWEVSTDPFADRDPTWLPMTAPLHAADPTHQGVTWTLPEGPDTWRVASLAESVSKVGGLKGDLNRDGDTTDTIWVLYNTTTHQVWVDANDNRSFADDPALTPETTPMNTVTLGKDNPATPINESVTMVVTLRREVPRPQGDPVDVVNLGFPATDHGTHVAGIAAAHRLFGGAASGAAPGATLVSSRACFFDGSCSSIALNEGMIRLIADLKVNVVNMSIGGIVPLNDGASARCALYNRLIDTYGVPIVLSGGNNGPGVNTIGDPGTTSGALTVGASASAETVWSNYGAKVAPGHRLQNYSSLGPREDGGFKPSLSAPGSAISTVLSQTAPPAFSGVAYSVPPGYGMQNGTSMAAPQAAGALAALMSGAAQNKLALTPGAWSRALMSSATWIEGMPAAAQGTGLLNAPAAWKLLPSLANTRADSIGIKAPVCSALADQLTTPRVGTGIYTRCSAATGGARAKTAAQYPVTLTAPDGAPSGRYTVGWRGNDGTFTAPTSVTLTPGTPVTLTVTSTPDAPGLHSAVMVLDHPESPGLDGLMLATVIVPETLGDALTAPRQRGSVDRLASAHHFIDVPAANATALQVSLTTTAPGSQVRWTAVDPQGIPRDRPTATSSCFTHHSDKGCNPNDRGYAMPLPGVWELAVENRRGTPYSADPYRLTTSLVGVKTSGSPTITPVPSEAGAHQATWTLTNPLATAHLTFAAPVLTATRTRKLVMQASTAMSYTVEVPPGTSWFSASVADCSVTPADIDVVILSAAGSEVAAARNLGCQDTARVSAPPAGTYTVSAIGYNLHGNPSTPFSLSDTLAGESVGTAKVTPDRGILGHNESLPVSVTGAPRAPVAPRTLGLAVDVRSTRPAGTVLTLTAPVPEAQKEGP